MPISDQDHGGIAVPIPAAASGGLLEALDLGDREIFAGAYLAVSAAAWCN
jgi:hypothetical protein